MKTWSPPRKRCRLSGRDIAMLFIGFYVGAIGTVILAYFWEQLL